MNNFIIFEGADFCGKTTILNLITNRNTIKPLGFHTREPGSYLSPSSFKCEKYRQQLLNNKNSAKEETKLFSDSRLIHTQDIIQYLNIDNVICDRYIVSSLAYQGYAQELGKDYVYDSNQKVLELLKTNNIKMNIIKFDISHDEWIIRKNKRLQSTGFDNIEKKSLEDKILEFYSTDYINEYYTTELNANHYNIDANQNIEDVYNDVIQIINKIKGGN